MNLFYIIKNQQNALNTLE